MSKSKWMALGLSAWLLVGCGAEEEADEETSSAGAPAEEAAPAVADPAVAPEEAEGSGDGVVVRDEEGNTVAVGPNGEVAAEDSETGETTTVDTQDGTTTVEGGNGEEVVTGGGDTVAREGGNVAGVDRNGRVVASDGDDTVVIQPGGRGIRINGLNLGR
ncbi:MAG: hypothetical protein H6719_30650 [Sandaracinaceae bacterium]|nr:hypothetical protein [Sandaracinaceae bacterium]